MGETIVAEDYVTDVIADKRSEDYKLIDFDNDDLGEDGVFPGSGEPEWELFDLKKDPLELFNVYHDPAYAKVVADMTRKLDAHMLEIGDVPRHQPIG